MIHSNAWQLCARTVGRQYLSNRSFLSRSHPSRARTVLSIPIEGRLNLVKITCCIDVLTACSKYFVRPRQGLPGVGSTELVHRMANRNGLLRSVRHETLGATIITV